MTGSGEQKSRSRGCRRRILLSAVVWGAITFAVSFGGFWYLDDTRRTFTIAAFLFPDTTTVVRYNYTVALLLTVPPLILVAAAGAIHQSWRVTLGAALVYGVPVATFFALVISEYR